MSATTTRAADLLGAVGIPHPRERLKAYPHEFSGGMRQRVMIAMALANDPKVLIADEPTTALDVTTQAQILNLIQRLQSELDSAIIMITHDLGVVAEICDDVLVMYGGRVAEQAQVDDLFERPQHPYAWGLLGSMPSRSARRTACSRSTGRRRASCATAGLPFRTALRVRHAGLQAGSTASAPGL